MRVRGSFRHPPMKTTKFLICAISIAGLIAAVRANSQTLSATLVDYSPFAIADGTLDNGSSSFNYPAGAMRFTEFDAFCVEPLQGISYGETLIYQVVDSSLLPNVDVIGRLVGGYLASPKSNEDAAAVQWAIWEITNETLLGPSLSDGNVRIDPASQSIRDLANFYLSNNQNYEPVAITYLTNGNRQDVISWNVIPEPGSAILAGLSSLLLLRRRR